MDQSDKGVGVLGWIFGHGPIIMSPHLESSVRGSLNLGGECLGLVEVGCGVDDMVGHDGVSFLF